MNKDKKIVALFTVTYQIFEDNTTNLIYNLENNSPYEATVMLDYAFPRLQFIMGEEKGWFPAEEE